MKRVLLFMIVCSFSLGLITLAAAQSRDGESIFDAVPADAPSADELPVDTQPPPEQPIDAPPADETTSSLDYVVGTPMPLPTRMPRPAPVNRFNAANAVLTVYFETIPQGRVGLAQVRGNNVASVRARFLEKLIDFFPDDEGNFYGLLSVGMEQTPKSYPLDVFVSYADGTRESINTEVLVVLGYFIRQDSVIIPPNKGFLLDPEMERSELARLESIIGGETLEKHWDSTGFQMPILATLTSPFGAFRTFNNTLNTRHTGWDIKTTLGVPVLASAAGEVVYAGQFNIRGSYVLVDHGYGVYSGYAHFSQVHVTRGEKIAKGQVLGMTGDSGRTSGPHFHWEMAVNGNWVDSVQLLELWTP